MNSCKFNAGNGLPGDFEGILWHLLYHRLDFVTVSLFWIIWIACFRLVLVVFYWTEHIEQYGIYLLYPWIEIINFLLIIEYHCDFFSWWQHASNLASYEQQDAHEFFISILDHIHENIKDDQHKSHAQGSKLLLCYFLLYGSKTFAYELHWTEICINYKVAKYHISILCCELARCLS